MVEDETRSEAQFDSNRAVKYIYKTLDEFSLRSTDEMPKPSIDVSFKFLIRNASSYLIRKRSAEMLYNRVKDDHFFENEGTRKSPATCLSVLEDAIQGSRIAPPPLSVRAAYKRYMLVIFVPRLWCTLRFPVSWPKDTGTPETPPTRSSRPLNRVM